jgi:choline dehydrogenase-like flavoprotein
MYGKELEAAHNVQLVVWANAVDLPSDPSGRVASASVATTTGIRFGVEARVFVAALGGIETPRLLLASNGGRGLGNEHDLVGRFFMDHLDWPAGFALTPGHPGRISLYDAGTYRRRDQPDVGVKGLLKPSDATMRARQLQGSTATFDYVTDLAKASPEQAGGAKARDVAALFGEIESSARTLSLVSMTGEQRPNPASRVMLGSEVDALGMPKVVLDWKISPEDRTSMLEGLELAIARLGRAGRGRVQIGTLSANPESKRKGFINLFRIDPAPIDPATYPVQVGFHHMGTTRMATAPTRGVVDANCRIHSSPNVFVAGSSLFPTSGCATPTYTLVALALRLGAHLRREVLR